MIVNNNVKDSSIGTFVGGTVNIVSPEADDKRTKELALSPRIKLIIGLSVAAGAALTFLSNANGALDLVIKLVHFVW